MGKERLSSDDELRQVPIKPGKFRITVGRWSLGDEAIESLIDRDNVELGEAQQIVLHGRASASMSRVDNEKHEIVFVGSEYGGQFFKDSRVDGLLFFHVNSLDQHNDERRVIEDIVIPWPTTFSDSVARTKTLQVKSVVMKNEAVSRRMAVGNHYHTVDSDRNELFVARGQQSIPLFVFNYSLADGDVVGVFEMWDGDACYVPPGIAHAFTPMVKDVELVGFSNRAYDSRHDVPKKLTK